MASYGTIYRPIASSTTSASKADQPDESKDSTRKNRNDFKLLCPYNIPLTPKPPPSESSETYVIDRRLVLALLAIVTAVELILTRAAIHLGVTLACGIPIILVHAILRVTDDLFVGEEACAAGELVPLVGVKTGDVESNSAASV
ncbi:hypothetical protein SLA2020_452770 [Shorea laevis]